MNCCRSLFASIVSLQWGRLLNGHRLASQYFVFAADLATYGDASQSRSPLRQPYQPTDTPMTWWRRVNAELMASSGMKVMSPLVTVALMVLSMVGHAADPERIFSDMGITHTPVRNQFNAATVGMMTVIRQYILTCPPDDVSRQAKFIFLVTDVGQRQRWQALQYSCLAHAS